MWRLFAKWRQSPVEHNAGQAMPSQEWLLENLIQPGVRVGLILRPDARSGTLEVRSSLIDALGQEGSLALAQTLPPVLPSSIGRRVELTFLARYFDRPQGRFLRVGYRTRLQEVEIPAQGRERLLVGRPQELIPTTLRRHPRLEPQQQVSLRRQLDQARLGLIDISLSGARINQLDPELEVAVGSTIDLYLEGKGLLVDLPGARVMRSRPGQAAVNFGDLPAKTRRRLQKALAGLPLHQPAPPP